MKKTNKELEEIIFGKTGFGLEEETRIYQKFFRDWQNNHLYLYKKFRIDFNEKILDIGCSYGYNLIHFSSDSLGIEATPRMVEFANKIGLMALSTNAENGLAEITDKFDLIWCSDFLVHLISPYKLLYDCRKLLKKDGRMMIQIPLMSIFGMHRSDCHTYAFNKKSLLYLLEMTGYQVIKTSGFLRRKPGWFNLIFEPFLQIFGGNIWVLAEKLENWTPSFERTYLPPWFED